MSNTLTRPAENKLPERSVGERIQSLGMVLKEHSTDLGQNDHLRPHQIDVADEYRNAVIEIAEERAPNAGMSVLHPTGSGKTITAAEVVRLTVGHHSLDGHRALMLVPSRQILKQTVGLPNESGALTRFTQGLKPAEYSGTRKNLGGNVVVMTYQSLTGALGRGAIEQFNPTLVVCDEAHHVIDGKWAEQVAEMSAADRLLVGLTATPAYSEYADVSRLFPRELGRMTIKTGIEDGILANLQSFTYRGGTIISLNRKGKDYSPSELFKLLGESDDNYMGAKICAQEVSRGHRGVVSCVPGYDRAHSRIMAKILNSTEITLPDGTSRNIRAAHVDGALTSTEMDKIMDDYRNGDLDILTYVDILLEGWDSPESDFTVLLRPTLSRVLAEQRIGRILRTRDGKVATVHEIVYDSTSTTETPVIHQAILDETTVTQGKIIGRTNGPRTKPLIDYGFANTSTRTEYNADNFVVDPDLAARLASLDALPLEEMEVVCGRAAVPLDWLSVLYLTRKFGLSADEVIECLEETEIQPRPLRMGREIQNFYPPRALEIVAKKAGMLMMPEGYMTLRDILRAHAGASDELEELSYSALSKLLKGHGFVPETYIDEDGKLIEAFPPEVMDVKPPKKINTIDASNRTRKQAKAPEAQRTTHQLVDTISWLESVLVSPADLRGNLRQAVMVAQKKLVFEIGTSHQYPEAQIKQIRKLIKEMNDAQKEDQNKELPAGVTNLMKAKKIKLDRLLLASIRAKASVGDPRAIS